MTSPLHLSQIPTLSTLYKTSSLPLPPSNPSSPLPPASPTLNAKISLIRTSITTLATTCIVNAANPSLLGGGGVDYAIHKAAGPRLLAECRTLNGCATGSAKITGAYDLPCRFVVHAVGPVYKRARGEREGLEGELLGGCYVRSLELGAEAAGKDVGGVGGEEENGQEEDGEEERAVKGEEGSGKASLAFSCLSTGVYGYPSVEAAEVTCRVVREWLLEDERAGRVERVVFCCFERKDERAYEEVLPKFFPPTSEDLAAREQEAAAASTEAGTVVAEEQTESREPQAKKQKTDSDLGNDWEKVEKPSATSSEKATEMSEGEKVEGVELAESDGEVVGKPVEGRDGITGEGGTGDGVQNKLMKDW